MDICTLGVAAPTAVSLKLAPDARSLAEVGPLLLLGLLVAQAEASRPEIMANWSVSEGPPPRRLLLLQQAARGHRGKTGVLAL